MRLVERDGRGQVTLYIRGSGDFAQPRIIMGELKASAYQVWVIINARNGGA